MKRYPHYWWPLKGEKYPSRIAVLDCDSRCPGSPALPGVQKEELAGWTLLVVALRAGVPNGQLGYTGEAGTLPWGRLSPLLSSRDNTWLFCSPASRILPLIGFWDMLEDKRIFLAGKGWTDDEGPEKTGEDKRDGVCILEDPPTIISAQLQSRPGKLLILDIRNWGIDLLSPELSANDRAARYIKGIRDCLLSLRSGGQGTLRCSAGSQAVSSLRTAYNVVRLHCHVNGPATKLERAAYFGGRCECYRIGDVPGPVYHVDVRSMYPSLCLDLPIPVSMRSYHDASSAERACRATGGETSIAHVRIRSAVPAYPLRRRGRIVYPVGEYDTYLCGPELRHAVSACSVTRWYAAVNYTTAPYLGGFYRHWLDQLSAARGAGRLMECQWIKRVMNALIGKFGEPGKRWVPCQQHTEHGPYGEWEETGPSGGPARHRNIAWYTQREEISGESYWSIPAIAAWITAAGRQRLWYYISTAGLDNVWYVDTDSLLVGETGYNALLRVGAIREGENGHLRLIGKHSRCVIHGIRHYELDGTVSCAGVPRGTIEPGETREQYFLRLRIASEISMGRNPGGERYEMRYPKAEKYRHGRVLPDGRVVPLEIYDGRDAQSV